jgi:UDP-glucose:(heptosyl)LPS alpha-1,3-glucosyltransferase
MKVAVVQEHVDAQRGGAETSTLEMARHLAALGLDVTVVCAASGTANADDAPAFRLERIPVGGRARFWRTVRFVQDANRFCRMGGFDIVHAVTPCFCANVYQPRGGTYAETIARSIALARTPLGRALKRVGRRFNRRQRFLQSLERRLLGDRDPPFVAAVSDYVRRQVVVAFDLPPDRVRVVFNGVDAQAVQPDAAARHRRAFREQLAVAADAPLVLFVAHNFKLKGLAELLRAAAAGSPAWRIVVAGRDNPARYARLARRLGIVARVAFVGTDTPVEALYCAADVLAHPTWYDPCSRVVLEALSLGLPVVTTRFNGAAEAIEPGRHGIVVESPDQTETLARALADCLKPAIRAACTADAPALRERLSMGRHARGLRELYGAILD